MGVEQSSPKGSYITDTTKYENVLKTYTKEGFARLTKIFLNIQPKNQKAKTRQYLLSELKKLCVENGEEWELMKGGLKNVSKEQFLTMTRVWLDKQVKGEREDVKIWLLRGVNEFDTGEEGADEITLRRSKVITQSASRPPPYKG